MVEEGRIYFLYRPRVNVDHPTSVNDIQRFFMILAPTSRPKAHFRLLIIGKKRLPIADRHERFFGFVEATAGTARFICMLSTQPPEWLVLSYSKPMPCSICHAHYSDALDMLPVQFTCSAAFDILLLHVTSFCGI